MFQKSIRDSLGHRRHHAQRTVNTPEILPYANQLTRKITRGLTGKITRSDNPRQENERSLRFDEPSI